MLTSLGRFLRKLRIDRNEILKDMSDKLSVTPSFLSAVENGKKKMPSSWNNQICGLYDLDEAQQEEFTKAIAESEDRIELTLVNTPTENKELAIAFARNFSDFNDRQLEQLRDIIIK